MNKAMASAAYGAMVLGALSRGNSIAVPCFGGEMRKDVREAILAAVPIIPEGYELLDTEEFVGLVKAEELPAALAAIRGGKR